MQSITVESMQKEREERERRLRERAHIERIDQAEVDKNILMQEIIQTKDKKAYAIHEDLFTKAEQRYLIDQIS